MRVVYLDGSNDLELQADVRKQLQFPGIVHTTLHPDVVMTSAKAKKIVIDELTVPWEGRCTEEIERTKSEYD